MGIEYITEHVALTKCACPCCDLLKVTPGLFSHMKLLEQMRQEMGFAMIITSAYRCPDHNREVGGAVRSWHLLFATDIRPGRGSGFKDQLHGMYKVALSLKWGGIGYYNNFLHLDMRPDPVRWQG